MNKIKFTKNLNNKLEMDIFPTIRKSSPEKVLYYENNLYENFEVIVKGKKVHTAKLVYVHVYEFEKIPYYFLMLDTGKEDYEDIKNVFLKFYKKIRMTDEFLILLFKKV